MTGIDGRTGDRFRWYVCFLLFLAWTTNYVDRQVLGLLAPTLQPELGWSEIDYGRIVLAFQFAYAGAMLPWGWLIDRFGVERCYAVAVLLWSLAAVAHGAASSALQFAFVRFLLGLGEAANVPCSIATLAVWFSANERSLAVGLMNSGSNVGAVLSPIIVEFTLAYFGWRAAFFVTGSIGFVWLALWWCSIMAANRAAAADIELEAPEEEEEERKEEGERKEDDEEERTEEPVEESVAELTMMDILRSRRAWAFGLAKLLTDGTWWFWLFWLPKFFKMRFGIEGTALVPYLVTIYVVSDVGSFLGGWIPALITRTQHWPPGAAIKTTMFFIGATCPLVVLCADVTSPWLAAAFFSLATFCHQAYSANLFALGSLLYPAQQCGRLIGFGAMLGGLGGMAMAETVGHILQANPSFYLPMFVWSGFCYLIALAVFHLLVPQLQNHTKIT